MEGGKYFWPLQHWIWGLFWRRVCKLGLDKNGGGAYIAVVGYRISIFCFITLVDLLLRRSDMHTHTATRT